MWGGAGAAVAVLRLERAACRRLPRTPGPAARGQSTRKRQRTADGSGFGDTRSMLLRDGRGTWKEDIEGDGQGPGRPCC